MSFCCVGNCSKKRGGALGNGDSDIRGFIRWYKFPRDKTIRKKWIARVRRRPTDVSPDSMAVCSDHFEDDDFEPRGLLQADILLQAGRLKDLTGKHIKLKEDAIPNTERSSGLARVGPPKAEKALRPVGDAHADLNSSLEVVQDLSNISTSSSTTKRPRSHDNDVSSGRKRVCRNMGLKRIDELIEENKIITQSSGSVVSSPIEEPTLYQEPEPTCSHTMDKVIHSSQTHRDQAVQHQSIVKSKQTQVGGPCDSLKLKVNQVDFEDSTSSSSTNEDYTPIHSNIYKRKLDFTQITQQPSSKKRKTKCEKKISRVIGDSEHDMYTM